MGFKLFLETKLDVLYFGHKAQQYYSPSDRHAHVDVQGNDLLLALDLKVGRGSLEGHQHCMLLALQPEKN